jgi:hypothetical protein
MTSSRKRHPVPTTASCPIRPLIGYAAPARATRRFAQGTASVTLRADRSELIRDAETTLYSYAHTRTAPSRWTITLHTGVPVDQAGADALFADADDHDIGPNLQAQSIGVPGGRAFWIRDHATLVHLDDLLGTITVHADDLDAARFFAARLVRQAMTAQLLEHDAVYAHAAALVRADHGLLIAGPQGAQQGRLRLADALARHCQHAAGRTGDDQVSARRTAAEQPRRPVRAQWQDRNRAGRATDRAARHTDPR